MGILLKQEQGRSHYPECTINKVNKSNQHPALDYNHGNKRNAKLRVANNKSLVRANQYDVKSKIKQEQKLKNILRLQNKKGAIRMQNKYSHLNL